MAEYKYPKIESYQFGEIVIDGITYQKDVIIFPDHIVANWRREQGHSLNMIDLQKVIANKPDILIIGTGKFGRMQIPPETLAKLEEIYIEVIPLKSEQACEVYYQRKSDGRVIAAIHLTC